MKFNECRILAVKLADIGDAVLSLPALQGLRASAPGAKIDVLTTEAGANVFTRSKAIDEVIPLRKQQFNRLLGLVSPRGISDLISLAVRLRRTRYDVVILLHHLTTGFGALKFRALVNATGAPVIAGLDNGRGRFLTNRSVDYGFGECTEWEYGLEVIRSLGIECQLSRPEITIDEQSRDSTTALLKRNGIVGDYAILHAEVGEFSPARAWPDDLFANLARQIQHNRRIPVVLVGVEPTRPGIWEIAGNPDVHNLCGQTSFDQLCALIDGASLVVGADSSVSHLTAAFDRPLISLFGPSNVEAWKPFASQVIEIGQQPENLPRQVALTRNLPCSPCIYRGFSLGRPEGCRARRCMTELLPEDVIPIITSVAHSRLDG